jgi:branched-chain amino acid transport system substrate-binding protein
MTKKLLLVVFAFALVVAACSDDDGADTTTTAGATETTTTTTAAETTTTAAETTTTAAAETTTTAGAAPGDPGELVVGYVLPQTGDLSAIIDALVKPLEMGVEEITAAGGEIRLVPGDSGTDPNVASATTDQLLADDVDVIIGAAGSGVSLSIIDKITGSQVLQCSGSNTAASLTDYDDGGFYFRTAPSDILQGPALADVMTDLGAATVGIVYRNDDYGAGFNTVLAEGLAANGVTVAAQVAYDPNTTSFDAEAAEVAAAGVDSVAIITFGEGAALLQAMIEAGVGPADVSIYVADGFKDTVSAELVDPNNPAVLEGVVGTAPSSAPPNGEPGFIDRLEAFAPGTPTIFSAHKYDCLMVMKLASDVAGSSDPAVFVNEIIGVTTGGTKCSLYEECKALIAQGEDIDYDGASGPLEFTDVGEPGLGVYDVYEYDAEGVAVTYDQIPV